MLMRRPIQRLLLVLSFAVLAAACESPTAGGGVEPARDEARIGFALDLSGLAVNTLVVHVTAADITTPLVFNVPVANGTASGSITVPAGLARTITVRAYDPQGTLTHEGSTVVQQVRPGANVSVVITLVPRAGNVPITINMGSLVMTVFRVRAPAPGGDRAGDTIRFQARVTQSDGTPVPDAAVRWASTNPALATVDNTGLVTARAAGSVEIVATYAGYGASQTLTFAPAASGSSARLVPQPPDPGAGPAPGPPDGAAGPEGTRVERTALP